jgi:hypothetical protein
LNGGRKKEEEKKKEEDGNSRCTRVTTHTSGSRKILQVAATAGITYHCFR